MSSAIIALGGEYLDTRTFRYARTQREAGIEYMQWGERMKPLRPIYQDVLLGVGALCVAAGAMLFV
jgi:hypothetical protein